MWQPFTIFGTEIAWTAVFYSGGIILGIIAIYIDTSRYQIPRKEIIPIITWGFIGAMAGQKLFFLIFFTDGSAIGQFADSFLSSGSMYYGAELFGFAASVTYVWITKLPVLAWLDMAALGTSIAHGVGRIGCFAVGCCYGIPTDSFLGATFPFIGFPVHPTQLYEAFALIILFIILWFTRKRIKIVGLIYPIYVMSYSVIRFIIEFYRDDGYPVGFLGISASQHIALTMFIFASIFMYILIRNNKKALR